MGSKLCVSSAGNQPPVPELRAELSMQVPGCGLGLWPTVCPTQRKCGCTKPGDGDQGQCGALPSTVTGSGAKHTEATHVLAGLEAGLPPSEEGNEAAGGPRKAGPWEGPGSRAPAGLVGVCGAFLLP